MPSERKPRSASSCTAVSTRSLSSSLLCAMRRMYCGAPLVTLKTALSGAWIVASVRLSVGLKGSKASSVKAARRARSSLGMAFVMHESMASWLPISRLEASAA